MIIRSMLGDCGIVEKRCDGKALLWVTWLPFEVVLSSVIVV